MNKHKNTKVASEAKSKPKIVAKPRVASASQLKAKQTSTVAKEQGAKKPLAKQQNIKNTLVKTGEKAKKKLPDKVPFWARLKISKHRTTLVIDKDIIIDKKTKKKTEGFVHREATHTYKKEFEEIKPNPDKEDNSPMYLKRPSKLPKKMFEPHNKDLEMPEHLRVRYDKNNKKQ